MDFLDASNPCGTDQPPMDWLPPKKKQSRKLTSKDIEDFESGAISREEHAVVLRVVMPPEDVLKPIRRLYPLRFLRFKRDLKWFARQLEKRGGRVIIDE